MDGELFILRIFGKNFETFVILRKKMSIFAVFLVLRHLQKNGSFQPLKIKSSSWNLATESDIDYIFTPCV